MQRARAIRDGRRQVAALLLALGFAAGAGCYRGGAGLTDCEVACGVDVDCPAGLVCGQSGRCTTERGASCDGLAGDGPVADARDCSGHDEDLDSRPDQTDPCPLSMFDDRDGDSDGTPPACDPDDSESGDRVARFDGLPGCVEYEESAGWQVDVAQHLVRTVGTPDLAWLRWAMPGLGTRFAISAEVELVGPTGPNAWLGIGRGLGGTRAEDATGFVCRIELSSAQGQTHVTSLPDANRTSNTAMYPVPTGMRYRLSFESSSTSTQCRFSRPDGAEPNGIGSSAPSTTADDVGIIIHGAELIVHWFMVVTIDRP